ncbi:MAG TPA: SH3 domain-containing protein [Candidatus Ozemobacteraceae bacterium]|nr:SH3 domain-containing protein [Candidatus Ozemobacteraceae bacterium]
MNRKSVVLLVLACVALLYAVVPAGLYAEDPLTTLENHDVGDSGQTSAATTAGTSAQTATQMEKTVSGLEALVKQYEDLIKKLEGQVKDAESGAVAGEEGTVEVNSSLNIRSGPWGKVIGGFTNGEKVRIIGKDGPWYKIAYAGGTAYVHQNYVSTASQPAGQVPVVYPADYGGAIVDGTQASSDGSSSSTPVTPAGDLQTRVVNAAQALVGQKNFPYDPLTQGGAYGCAQVVSTALKNAGVVSRIRLCVSEVMADLKAIGWTYAQVPPYRAGDVITWKTYDSDGDGVDDPDTHIGIIMGSGNSVQAMNNSSSQKMPRLCAANAMTLSHVLRKV